MGGGTRGKEQADEREARLNETNEGWVLLTVIAARVSRMRGWLEMGAKAKW